MLAFFITSIGCNYYDCHENKMAAPLVWANLSWSEHIKSITAKAYRSLHLIHKTFSSPSSSMHLHLCLSLVCSQLCYCSQQWRPRLLKDIICLEQIQRRATKFILCDNFFDYKSRLCSLHLLPLMHWLEFLENMFIVKCTCIQNPQDNLDISSFISFVRSRTITSTSMRLQRNFCHSSSTRHFYFNRMVLLWNAIPSIDISQPFLTICRHIMNFLWEHFGTVFNPDIPCTFYIVCPLLNLLFFTSPLTKAAPYWWCWPSTVLLFALFFMPCSLVCIVVKSLNKIRK